MKAIVASLATLMLSACPAPSGMIYSVSSPIAAKLTGEYLQPIVDRYEFDGEIRVSGGAMDGARLGRGKIWPWASVTKQVVATLVMQDVEAGRLALDEPVSAYLNDWPATGPLAPTLRQLQRHQSGLYDPEDDENYTFDPSRPLDPMVCVNKRVNEPGGAFDYTNCDTLLVGRILERINGEPLAKLVQDRIAEPAGMQAAQFVNPDTPLAQSAKGTPSARISLYGASGGLAGTADDLLAFDQALMDGRLLSPQAREEMWDGDPALGYTALGQWESVLALDGCPNPVRIIERRGAIGGYQARNFILPERDIAIVALIGQGEADYPFGEPWSRKGLSFDLLSAAACQS